MSDRLGLAFGVIVCVAVMGCPGTARANPIDAHSLYTPTGPEPAGEYQTHYGGGLPGGAENVIAGVPAYAWYRGCGPTAAGMVIGYWDGQGFDALIPGNASSQTQAVDDAIATDAHYNDYSLPKDYSPNPILPDKSEPPAGDEHASNSVADFMKTSWSARNNYWGWSWMSDVDNALSDYTAWVNTTYGASYAATSWNEIWSGNFSWDDFKAEIDAKQPMVFLVDSNGDGGTDHFVTAIGYRDTLGYPEYAAFDTWTTTGYRWERFRQMSASYAWGIYGATYFHIVPEPSTFALAALALLGLLTYTWRR